MRPIVIGIVPSYDRKEDRYLIDKEYIEAIEKAGGLPFLIPYLRSDEALAQVLDHIHGLLLSGGGDLDPVHYGQEPQNVKKLVPERDHTELFLTREAFARGLPILGICRGIQSLNVALGGTLIQDLKDLQHYQDAEGYALTHSIRISADSYLAQLLGATETRVNSFHHQAVDQVAPPLRATAWAPDGTIEAVESRTAERFALGVQFHIELLYERHPVFFKIFEAFVDRARAYQEVGISEGGHDHG